MSYSRIGYPNQWFTGKSETMVYMSVEDMKMKEHSNKDEDFIDPVNVLEVCGSIIEKEVGYTYTTKLLDRLSKMCGVEDRWRKDNYDFRCPFCDALLMPERTANTVVDGNMENTDKQTMDLYCKNCGACGTLEEMVKEPILDHFYTSSFEIYKDEFNIDKKMRRPNYIDKKCWDNSCLSDKLYAKIRSFGEPFECDTVGPIRDCIMDVHNNDSCRGNIDLYSHKIFNNELYSMKVTYNKDTGDVVVIVYSGVIPIGVDYSAHSAKY